MRKGRSPLVLASLASLLVVVLPLPLTSSWPTGLVGPGDSCVSCHERGVFGVATTVARVNGIDPEWGANRGGGIAVGPGGMIEIEWRTTGFGYDYGETAGFIIVPNTTHWSVLPHEVADNGRTWTVPWTVASSDEKAERHDNWRTFVTAYDHVHRAGDDGFPGWRGYGADKDDGSTLDLNGIAHDEYLGARLMVPTAEGNHTLLFGAAGMPEPLVNKGSWIEVKVRVAPLAPPRVTVTRPADAAVDVSVLDPVELEFDRPMDRASTEAAFAMAPAAKGGFEWNADRTRVGFVPETIFAFSTDYQVTLSPSARDRSGVPVGSANAFGFTTQEKPPFTVYLTAPRGAERIAGGSIRGIEGAVLGGAPPYSVQILLSTDSGVSYGDEIAAFTMPDAGGFQRNWSVPAIDSGTVRVAARVRESGGTEVLGHTRDLAIDSTPPVVLSTIPSDGEANVSRFSPIVVAFSEPLDQSGTEDAFSILPAAPGILDWYADNLTLQPAELLFGSAEYSVSVSGGLRDLVGNPLTAPPGFRFQTDKDWSTPTVVFRTPAGSGASAFANVVVKFNKLMRHAETERAFSLRPAVTGSFSWDLATLTFTPAEGFAYSTLYNVTVNRSATDLVGFHPDTDSSWEFAVIPPTPPAIVARSPAGAGASISSAVEATFSDHMDQSTVEVAFSIAPETPVRFEWAGKRTVRAFPLEPLSGRTPYHVEISTIARNSRGIALSSPGAWEFTTGEGRDTIPPSVVHVQPDDVPDLSPLNITLGVEDNAGVVDVRFRFRTSPSSQFTERPMDLFAGTPRDGRFRAILEAPLAPLALEYELVVSDGDNVIVLPGGGDFFRVRFVDTRDRGFQGLGIATFAVLAPLAAYATLYAVSRGTRDRREGPAARPGGRAGRVRAPKGAR